MTISSQIHLHTYISQSGNLRCLRSSIQLFVAYLLAHLFSSMRSLRSFVLWGLYGPWGSLWFWGLPDLLILVEVCGLMANILHVRRLGDHLLEPLFYCISFLSWSFAVLVTHFILFFLSGTFIGVLSSNLFVDFFIPFLIGLFSPFSILNFMPPFFI